MVLGERQINQTAATKQYKAEFYLPWANQRASFFRSEMLVRYEIMRRLSRKTFPLFLLSGIRQDQQQLLVDLLLDLFQGPKADLRVEPLASLGSDSGSWTTFWIFS